MKIFFQMSGDVSLFRFQGMIDDLLLFVPIIIH